MIFVHRLQRDKYAEPMNGIPKGLCSFGGVQRQRLWSLFTAFREQRNNTKALRKGEFQKQSSGLFLKEGDSPRGGEMSQRDRGDGPD